MKPIRRTNVFEKHFKKRISTNQKRLQQFEKRLSLFVEGKHAYPLNDHSLTGKLVGFRAFSVAGDMRVIYKESIDEIIFLDIGTHAQIYNM